MADATALPLGYRVRLGATTHRCGDGRTLFGGTGTILRLRPAALAHLDTAGTVRVHDATSAALARLLLDRGLATPCWPGDAASAPPDELTVVVPVLDRPVQLERLLRSLGDHPVVVVDDGSRDAAAIRVVCRRHGAELLRHNETRGPAAARNTGLRAVTTPLVAFVDSDVVLAAESLVRLQRHLDDPRVGIVAPRVRGLVERGGALQRYEAARSSLDLGPDPALVQPHARVAYVPSAMLLARRAALGDGFDETMPVAEDVDLVWRVGRDWAVRYEPGAVVRHEHRTSARSWFARKACYGNGAALLAARHGRAVAPAVLTPWTAAVTVGLLAQRRWSPAVVTVATLAAQRGLARRLDFAEHPQRAAAELTAAGLRATLLQTASAVTRHYVPLTLALAPFSARARRAYVVAAVAGGLADHHSVRPGIDPVRYVGLRALDDLAYGLGLWQGVVQQRSIGALIPLLRRRSRGDNEHPRKGMDP